MVATNRTVISLFLHSCEVAIALNCSGNICYAAPKGVVTHRLRAAVLGESVGSSYLEFKKGSPMLTPAGNRDSF